MLIDKLKSELSLIRIASQIETPANWLETLNNDPIERKAGTVALFGTDLYKRIFTASCADDDDYYSRH